MNTTKDPRISQAVLEHVRYGAYPEGEDAVSAIVPSSALADVFQTIEQSQKELKLHIETVSRSIAPDVDQWIAQAKYLRSDIESSEADANGIQRLAHEGEKAEQRTEDIGKKTDLLDEELKFNENLRAILHRLRSLRKSLDSIQREILQGSILEAANALEDFSQNIPLSTELGTANVLIVLENAYTDYRASVTEQLSQCWNRLVQVNRGHDITFINQRTNSPSLEAICDALIRLGSLEKVLSPFCHSLERSILLPRLKIRVPGEVYSVIVDRNSLALSERSRDLSAQSLFSDLGLIIDFLRKELPTPAFQAVGRRLMPVILSQVISVWLLSSVPDDVNEFQYFENTIRLVVDFASHLQRSQWPGSSELIHWTEDISEVWLKKRSDHALSQVRETLSHGVGEIETVERVETQILDKNDEILAANGGDDGWNDNWSDEAETAGKAQNAEGPPSVKGEEDMTAWGLDEKTSPDDGSRTQVSQSDPEVDEDAWGWNSDNEESGHQKSPTSINNKSPKPKRNGLSQPNASTEQVVTLKETFNITAIPKEILHIIKTVTLDLSFLTSKDGAQTPMSAAVSGLLPLPALILAMFRASSPSTYALQANGSMYLYNDSLWLAEQITHLSDSFPDSKLTAQALQAQGRSFDSEQGNLALQNHGKRSYVKEMESQRTILADILDGAQGFLHCTQQPFSQECDIAVISAVDRLRMLNKEWSNVLSRTALLQSLGSLLATATSKIILDIEDMSDISEPESQRLTGYCNRIGSLDDLFLTDTAEQEKAVPATAFYVPNWFKFQYLTNILESSLVDIKYMWAESELSLEFQTEELVDLIIALFADSPYRRTAIAEIRSLRR